MSIQLMIRKIAAVTANTIELRNVKYSRPPVHKKEMVVMTVERYLRLIAGAFIILSVALGHFVSPYFYLFTAFVGLNLFQSAFTNWCPMMAVLKAFGVKGCCGTQEEKA